MLNDTSCSPAHNNPIPLPAITARQLQAPVRQRGFQHGTQPSPPHSHTTLSGTEASLPEPLQEGQTRAADRSEEHTSELQSPCNLVCRLLLEKKKKRNLMR